MLIRAHRCRPTERSPHGGLSEMVQWAASRLRLFLEVPPTALPPERFLSAALASDLKSARSISGRRNSAAAAVRMSAGLATGSFATSATSLAGRGDSTMIRLASRTASAMSCVTKRRAAPCDRPRRERDFASRAAARRRARLKPLIPPLMKRAHLLMAGPADHSRHRVEIDSARAAQRPKIAVDQIIHYLYRLTG